MQIKHLATAADTRLTHGAVERGAQFAIQQLLARNGQLRASFGEDCLAIPHLFDGILVASFGHL